MGELALEDAGVPPPLDYDSHLPLPPQKRKDGSFPGLANTGRPCTVETNHYTLGVKVPEGIIYMYEIEILPPWVRKYRRSDKKLYHAVVAAWKKSCPAVNKEQNSWVFDGYKTLYSTKNHKDEEFQRMVLTVYGEEEERDFNMTVIKVVKVMDINVNNDILDWASKGRSGFIPQDSIEALNVILKHAATNDLGLTVIGRSFFPPKGATLDLGFGKEVWTGIFSSVRPHGWKDHGVLLTLNVDTSNKPATQALHLTDKDGYVYQVLNGGRSKRDTRLDLSQGLTDFQIKLLTKDLEQLKVKYEIPCSNGTVRKRQYKVLEVRKMPANKEMINVEGDIISVADYFKHQYGISLKLPNLPCLWVGSRDKSTYIPMEFCTMMSQPMPRRKKLQDDAIANMIKQTAIKPLERQKKIKEGLMANNNMYKTDPYAKEFGLSLAGTMTKLTGRILNPPSISYKPNERSDGVVRITPQNPGKWFMDRNMFVSGVDVKTWAFLNLAGMQDSECKEIQSAFLSVGRENGLRFANGNNVLTVNSKMKDQEEGMMKIEGLLEKFKARYAEKGKQLDLIIIVFPFKAGLLYDKIKYISELKLNITTQCCLRSSLYKKGELSKQVVANICLKINSKLGGINHVLAKPSRPKLLSRPVMIMGADVSHPAPETRGIKPSIAAIVGSMDPRAVNYEVEVRMQDMGLESTEEVIKDMKNVTKKLLRKFYEQNDGRKPEKIVMFRDGCSEGQFLTVLAKELVAIRTACKELEENYQPEITFIVVQKRHHTRFFPTDNNKYKNGNALAGTVIDQGINHPTEGDFYLVSHEGIQGTSRPCHYHVLWDDSNFSADELETLAYYLCHLYSRCTRSVSYPTPTYYSHLVADRARKHHNEMSINETGGSISGGSAGSVRLTEDERRKIQDILENGVEKPMYFV